MRHTTRAKNDSNLWKQSKQSGQSIGPPILCLPATYSDSPKATWSAFPFVLFSSSICVPSRHDWSVFWSRRTRGWVISTVNGQSKIEQSKKKELVNCMATINHSDSTHFEGKQNKTKSRGKLSCPVLLVLPLTYPNREAVCRSLSSHSHPNFSLLLLLPPPSPCRYYSPTSLGPYQDSHAIGKIEFYHKWYDWPLLHKPMLMLFIFTTSTHTSIVSKASRTIASLLPPNDSKQINKHLNRRDNSMSSAVTEIPKTPVERR